MRIVTRDTLSALTAKPRRERVGLLQRINRYTLWAFNPQPELSSRPDRQS